MISGHQSELLRRIWEPGESYKCDILSHTPQTTCGRCSRRDRAAVVSPHCLPLHAHIFKTRVTKKNTPW